VIEAAAWGLIAASSLLLGALLALRLPISRSTLGLIMAFAAGVLISAVAYELVLDAVEEHDAAGAAFGLFTGAIVYFLGDLLLTRRGGEDRKSSAGPAAGSAALPIVLGIILDGVPESVVLGLTLLEGQVGLAMLAAVFLSNLPEAMAATTGLSKDGWPAGKLLYLWLGVTVVSGLAAGLGYAIFSDSSEATVAFILAFAGGAILTMLADTMMPEAFDDAGPLVGLVTTFGFAVAFAIQSLE
jgi:ZIP family zinc transporter